MTPTLPIDSLLPDIVRALSSSPALVLRAPTGAGKTTRVPPALLDLAGDGRIFVIEPRRLAARAAARRMAQERGERLGDTIGYHVRFDRQAGPKTQLLVVTPGILLRLLHDDPALEQASLILFDEFHERGLESDLALGMTRLLQQTLRPDLRLLVMSATFETDSISAYLGNCPVLTSEGRLHPVEISYHAPAARTPLPQSMAAAIQTTTSGDVLAFLPGVGEIRQTQAELGSWAKANNILLMPLYGDLPADQQDLALLPQSRRKVVLATNVAETSVTVEGVTVVVDSGLARQVDYDPAIGMDRLALVPISRASADQRAGRAGRTQPGRCLRLWHELDHRARPEQTEPEIRRVDLAGPVLHLLALGERNILGFPWLEAPKLAAIDQAKLLLERLGATHNGTITPLGQTMARMPVHPRLARLLIEGARRGVADTVALAAALLSERDPFLRDGTGSRGSTRSDLFDRVDALHEYERSGRTQFHLGSLNIGAAKFLLRARDQLLRSVRDEMGHERPLAPTDDAADRALVAAFPDRLARRREPGGRKGVMVGGRGVKLLPQSGVTEGELFVCLDVDAGETESLVRLASAVPRDGLPEDRVRTVIDLSFDGANERVIARKQICFEDLVLEETPAHLPAGHQVAQVLAEAALTRLDRVLPPADSVAYQFLLRVRWLRDAMPELNLPAFSDAELVETAGWLCAGKKTFAEVRAADWQAALASRLSHHQRQAVEREAPESWQVPSGSQIPLAYDVGKPPILAVRIQEVFGLKDTPRLAGGRVKVLLHLLAPNYRPQQVTDDLASFWANTYPLVRKEMRVRYPKHAWPEDPWTEPPRSGPFLL